MHSIPLLPTWQCLVAGLLFPFRLVATVANSFAVLHRIVTPFDALACHKGKIPIKEILIGGLFLNFAAIALITVFAIFIGPLFSATLMMKRSARNGIIGNITYLSISTIQPLNQETTLYRVFHIAMKQGNEFFFL